MADVAADMQEVILYLPSEVLALFNEVATLRQVSIDEVLMAALADAVPKLSRYVDRVTT